MYRHFLDLPFWAAGFYFSNYAVRGVVRRFMPSVARAIGWMHPVIAVPK
jgi:hypothetical protein